MTDRPSSPLRKMRTFAEDVRIARGHSELGTPSTTPTNTDTSTSPAANTPAPAAAAIKAFENVPTEHIPSFHELQKKTPAPVAAVTPKQPVTASRTPTVTVRAKSPVVSSNPVRPTQSDSATIITDKSTNKVGFIGGVIAAFSSWWSTQKKTAAQKKTPTYAVPDVERRKGVVQKATSKTGSIFTADAETLREEIRRRGNTPSPTPTNKEPDISWSPNTEVGYPLLPGVTEKSTPHNIQVAFKKTTVPAPLFVEPEPVLVPPAPVVPETLAAGEDERRWDEAPAQVYTPPVPAEPAVPFVPAPEPPVYVPEPEAPSTLDATVPATSDAPVAPRLSLGKLIPPIKATTNRLTVSITGAIILLVILGFGAKMLVGTLITKSNTVTLDPATPLLSGARTTDYALPILNKESVVAAMQSTQANETTEIRLIDTNSTPLKVTTTLSLLGFAESKNFVQTVAQARPAVIGSSRAIVINVSDAMTAFGALLNFEPQIVAALATPLAISDTSGGEFTDKTIGTIDVRIHTTSDGAENLVYGFISRDTILITTSTASFITFLGNR